MTNIEEEFETLHMKIGVTINNYFCNYEQDEGYWNKIDIEVVEKILRSMTPKFNYV